MLTLADMLLSGVLSPVLDPHAWNEPPPSSRLSSGRRLKGIHVFDPRLDACVSCPPQQPLDGPEQSLERLLPQTGHLDLGRRHNAGGAGGVVQEGELAKEIALAVVLGGPFNAALVGVGLAAHQQEKGVARVALLDDDVAGRVFPRLEGIRNLGPLVRCEALQDGHFLQEALVHSPPGKGRLHQDASERVAVEGPQGATWLGRDDRGGAGVVVHEGEFAKGSAGLDGADLLAHTVGSRL